MKSGGFFKIPFSFACGAKQCITGASPEHPAAGKCVHALHGLQEEVLR